MTVLIIIAAIIWDVVIAMEFNNIAKKKGCDTNKYFWYCFLFPFVGYLMVVALPCQLESASETQRKEQLLQEDALSTPEPGEKEALTTWSCVHCGTRNKLGQSRCSNCGKS